MAEADTASATAASYLYATGNVYLREGAGKDQKIITVIKKGEAVLKLGSKNDINGTRWFMIKTENSKTGYASSKYLTAKKDAIGTVKTTARLNVRKDASSAATRLGTLDMGKEVKYTATYKNANGTTWYLITNGKLTGWVSGNYVTKVK